MMQERWDIIIIGGGIAGYTAAKTMWEKSPSTTILLISEEDRIPYKRTKLSKFIAEGFEKNQFQLQPADWYQNHHIELLIQKRVISIDPQAHTITLETGECFDEANDITAVSVPPFEAQKDTFPARSDNTGGYTREFPINRTFSSTLKQIQPFLCLKESERAQSHTFYT